MTQMMKNTLLAFGLVMLVGCGEKPAAEVPAEASAVEAASAAAQNVVPAEQLLTGATALRGQTITIENVSVQSTFGTKGFWVQLPNPTNPTAGGSPFLVRTEGAVPAVGSSVDVTGAITAMSAESANEWVAAGSITENDKLLTEFATDYLVAESVTAATP